MRGHCGTLEACDFSASQWPRADRAASSRADAGASGTQAGAPPAAAMKKVAPRDDLPDAARRRA